MHIFLYVLIGFVPSKTIAEGVSKPAVFNEPADFNATAALIRNGVDVSSLTDLLNLEKGSLSESCAVACRSLISIFGEDKLSTQDESAYDAVINYFWSKQQQAAKPNCIFEPEKPEDVSTLVLLSRATQCPFAVRSGGHAAFAGASSIDGGITVTFEKMKKITLLEDKHFAAIEPGNLWFDIYTNLQELNLAVVGGRVSGIGVGGLVTGGGISFFANSYGWACDNVISFELVTASGEIVTASTQHYPDLFWALRGGGSNIGIVTKFNLKTFPHGPLMFGGQRRFLEPSFPSVIDAFVNLGINAATDTKAAQFIAITLNAATNTKIAIAELEYADPVPEPPIFVEYKAIPAFQDTTQLNTLAYFTQQLNVSNPKGFRETFWTASSKLDKEMVQFVFDISFEEFANIIDVQGIVPANTLQIITVPQLEQMQKWGGNTLGLKPEDGPIFLINLSTRWDKVEDDERVLRANSNVVRRMQEEAKRRDMVIEYLYMNYASQYQDVIGSYGESAEKLRAVAKKYDPMEVFQKLQPGYFKLDGAPAVMEGGPSMGLGHMKEL